MHLKGSSSAGLPKDLPSSDTSPTLLEPRIPQGTVPTAEIRQVGTEQRLPSLSLTRYCFWNATTPEKLKGQLLSKHDVNTALSLLGASTGISEVLGDLATQGQQLPDTPCGTTLAKALKANSRMFW